MSTTIIDLTALAARVPATAVIGKPGNGTSGVSMAALLQSGVPQEWIELQLSLCKRLVDLPSLWAEFQKRSTHTVSKPVSKQATQRVYIQDKKPANETPEQEIFRLKAENEALQQPRKARKLSVKVSEKGAISVYGIGRFPVTLYSKSDAGIA